MIRKALFLLAVMFLAGAFCIADESWPQPSYKAQTDFEKGLVLLKAPMQSKDEEELAGVFSGSADIVAISGGPLSYQKALDVGGAGDYLTYGQGITAQAIDFWIYLDSTTETIIDPVSGNDIAVSTGTLSYTDWDDAYIDAVNTNTITASAWHHVVIVSTTDVSLTSGINVGKGDFQICGLRFWSYDLSLTEAEQLKDGSVANYRRNLAELWDLPDLTGKASGIVATNSGATVASGGINSGNVYSFDGNDYINIDNLVSNLASDTEGTWIVWVKTDDYTATQEIISFGDTDADTRIQFDINSNGLLRALAGISGATKWAVDTDAAVIFNNIWKHLALVQDGTSPVLYVNAVPVSQTFSTSTDKTIWFSDMSGLDNGRIGCGNWNNGGNATFLSGDEDRVWIYDTVMTQLQIMQHYQQSLRGLY